MKTSIPFFCLAALAVVALLPVAAQAALIDSLVGYYNMDGTGNDTSGSANVNNGMLTDSATSGAVGTLEASFDSSQKAFGTQSLSVTNADYLSLGNPTDYQFGTDSFTIAYWMRIPETISSDPTIIGNKDWSSSGGADGLVQAIGGDDVKANGAFGGARKDTGWVDLDQASASQGPANTPADAWVFLAMVVDRDDNLMSNYVADTWVPADSKTWSSGTSGQDFGPDSSDPATVDITGLGSLSAPASNTLNVGQDGDGGGYSQLTAHIDDVAVWNRALSRAELWEIYATGRIDQQSAVGNAIPEPTTCLLLVVALLGLLPLQRRRMA